MLALGIDRGPRTVVAHGDRRVLRNEWIVMCRAGATTFAFTHRLFSRQQFRWLLAEAGFENVRLYGNLIRLLYDADSARLVAVARTPGALKPAAPGCEC